MAILDKLAFWKKKEEFDLGELGSMPGEEKPGMAEPAPFEKEIGAEPGFPEEPSARPAPAPTGMPEEPAGPDFGAPPGGPAPTAMPPAAHIPSPITSRDVELISAKLDTIRAMLENINQRLAALEKIAKSSEHETYPRY